MMDGKRRQKLHGDAESETAAAALSLSQHLSHKPDGQLQQLQSGVSEKTATRAVNAVSYCNWPAVSDSNTCSSDADAFKYKAHQLGLDLVKKDIVDDGVGSSDDDDSEIYNDTTEAVFQYRPKSSRRLGNFTTNTKLINFFDEDNIVVTSNKLVDDIATRCYNNNSPTTTTTTTTDIGHRRPTKTTRPSAPASTTRKNTVCTDVDKYQPIFMHLGGSSENHISIIMADGAETDHHHQHHHHHCSNVSGSDCSDTDSPASPVSHATGGIVASQQPSSCSLDATPSTRYERQYCVREESHTSGNGSSFQNSGEF